jgi:hypothetical protein
LHSIQADAHVGKTDIFQGLRFLGAYQGAVGGRSLRTSGSPPENRITGTPN